MILRPLALALLSALCLTASAFGQAVPTFDDLVVGTAPLDAGGSVPVRMDVYRPAGITTPVPVVLWIHGGGWMSGDHDSLPGSALLLLQDGIALATIDYRLSSEAIFPAQIEDVKGAVRYLRASAATLGIDGARIACWGSSAGGHLAALLATSAGVTACEGATGGNLQYASDVLAAVDDFGPTDLVQSNLDVTTPPGSIVDHDAPASPESQLLGFDGAGEGLGVLRANLTNPAAPFPALAALASLANPITHVDGQDPPVFVAHGTDDPVVPLHQSERLVSALQAASVGVIWRPALGAAHGGLGTAIDAEARAFLVLHLSDCDANGVLDATDVAGGTAADTDGDGVLDACEARPAGTALCLGDGSGAACPCGNNVPPGSVSGCRHSLAIGGRLAATGSASIASDTLVLLGTQMPSSSALYFQGSSALVGGNGVAFGDGLRCAGGSVVRLDTTNNVAGASRCPIGGEPSVSVRGLAAAGSVRVYQVWFRNAATFCTAATFNFTNGVRLTWSP